MLTYAVSGALNVDLLLPFAAGSFVYIAASDLLPKLRRPVGLTEKLALAGLFAAALLALYGIASLNLS